MAVNQNTVQQGSSAHRHAWAVSKDGAKSRFELFFLVIFIFIHFQNDILYILSDFYKKAERPLGKKEQFKKQNSEQHLRKCNLSEFKLQTRILLRAYIQTKKNYFYTLAKTGKFL